MPATVASPQQRRIRAEDVRVLYDEESWWPERELADLQLIIDSNPCVGAWDGDRLVGFARAVTDGRFRAYVEDVIVAKDHRGTGCGRQLLDRLHDQLGDIDIVSLFCGADLVELYAAVGYRFTRQQVGHQRGSQLTAR